MTRRSGEPILDESSWDRLLAIVIAMILVATAIVVGGAKPAEAAANDLTIISPSRASRGLYICENWTASTATASTCTSGIDGYLLPGQNSRVKYNRADFDGIRVDAGWSLKKSSDNIIGDGDDHTKWGCRASTFWAKVQPSIADPGENEDYYYLWNCPAY